MKETKHDFIDDYPYIQYTDAPDKEPGGGSDVTVEALTITENGEYSEEGKAYSPVTVNVSGGGTEYSVKCYTENDSVYTEIESKIYKANIDEQQFVPDTESGAVSKAEPGDVLSIFIFDNVMLSHVYSKLDDTAPDFVEYPADQGVFVMPSHDVCLIMVQ